jgi:tRNA nucleotidyltransferase/poly(A) polymerase
MKPQVVLAALRRNKAVAPLQAACKAWADPVYYVGGTLRDAALGATAIEDIDLAVPRRASAFAQALARQVRGTCFTLHQETQVFRVVAKKRGQPDWQFDVALLQGSLAKDLTRRDFTVNAMALEVGGNTLHDPFGGLADLTAKRLRVTSPKVLKEDPIRLLRAFRLAAKHGLRIDKSTLTAIGKYKRGISKPAGERIHSELTQLASSGPLAPWLRQMDQSGLLTQLLPELERQRRCAEGYYGKGGVLRHTLDAVERLDFLLANLHSVYPRYAKQIEALLDQTCGGARHHKGIIRLAVLLHDIAKPATAKRIGGRLRFFQHEAVGAKMSRVLLKALRFSREEIELIEPLVYHHLRPGNLAANKVISDKAVFRFFRDLGTKGISLLLLCWADHASYISAATLKRVLGRIHEDPHTSRLTRLRSPDTRKTLFHLQVISYLLARYFEHPSKTLPKRLLSGDAIMKALKITPGPQVGEAMRTLAEAQAEGKVTNRKQAIEFLKSAF